MVQLLIVLIMFSHCFAFAQSRKGSSDGRGATAKTSSSYSGKNKLFYLDIHSSFRILTLNQTMMIDKPSLHHYTIGPTLGVFLASPILLYASYDYGISTQQSSTTNGNYRGKSTAISAGLGYKKNRHSGFADATFSGNYSLDNANLLGQKTIYLQPSGFKITYKYNFTERLGVGVLYENLKYKKQSIGGAESDLTSAIDFTGIGIGIGFNY